MSSPPVVQTILDSFTRCFNPLEPCTQVCSSNAAGGGGRDGNSAGRRSRGSSRAATPTSQLFGLDIGSGVDGLSSRAVSRSHSSSDSRKKQAQKLSLDMSYDADGVAKAKKTHNKIMVSAEVLEEKSMKRKLEIFRGTEQEASRRPKLAPRQQKPSQPTSGRSSPRDDLLLSDDEEELIRLTQSRKRFACGMNADRLENTSPMSSVARLFNFGLTEAQKPFGLCFATPVRTASQEDIANMSDDKLTDDEFRQRHVAGGGDDSAMVTPRDQDQHSSLYDEETINSTLYFDQKISHLVQTRPPMPLFEENMVNSREDELTQIIKRRSGDAPPVEMITSKTRRKGASRGSKGGSPRASPFREVFRGSPRASPFRDLGKGSNSVSPRSSPFRDMGKGSSHEQKPPSPARIGTESMSVTTVSVASQESACEERIEVQKLLDPDILHSTAAEF